MALQDTDLIMVNRAGTNYKISGSELKELNRLQDTDQLMIQQSGALYRVSAGRLRDSAQELIDGPTNFFLVQRGDELFHAENPFKQQTLPKFILELDTSGLQDSDAGLQVSVLSGTSIDGFSPTLQLYNSANQEVGTPTPLNGNPNFSVPVSSLNTDGAVKAAIYGQFTSIFFRGSKALTTVTWDGGANSWQRMFPTPTATFGKEMFKNCSKLTHVFGMTGYGDAPPAGVLQSLNNTFSGASIFNGDISSWLTGSVTDCFRAFYQASLYNKTLAAWDMGNVTDFSSMFEGAPAFNQPLNVWNVSKGKNFNGMFAGCVIFDRPLDQWTLTALNEDPVTDVALNRMFDGCSAFNQNLKTWCVSAFPSEPSNFSNGSGLTADNQPLWGTCP